MPKVSVIMPISFKEYKILVARLLEVLKHVKKNEKSIYYHAFAMIFRKYISYTKYMIFPQKRGVEIVRSKNFSHNDIVQHAL